MAVEVAVALMGMAVVALIAPAMAAVQVGVAARAGVVVAALAAPEAKVEVQAVAVIMKMRRATHQLR